MRSYSSRGVFLDEVLNPPPPAAITSCCGRAISTYPETAKTTAMTSCGSPPLQQLSRSPFAQTRQRECSQ